MTMNPVQTSPRRTAALAGKGGPTLASRQSGASLIEVLVAVLVFSIGLLGMAGLASATFGYNKTAQLRMTGLTLANDYAERARMNIAGFDNDGYTLALSDSAPSKFVFDNTAIDQADDTTAASNVAQSDRYEFLTEVARRLPGGEAVVKVASTPSTRNRGMDLWILWQEPNTSADVFTNNQASCPEDLSTDNKAIYSCMYFRVVL